MNSLSLLIGERSVRLNTRNVRRGIDSLMFSYTKRNPVRRRVNGRLIDRTAVLFASRLGPRSTAEVLEVCRRKRKRNHFCGCGCVDRYQESKAPS